jgi:hypothetical protein
MNYLLLKRFLQTQFRFDYFFTAVLVLVEREIIELSDGKNFKPENTVKGLDFFETLKKMMRFY